MSRSARVGRGDATRGAVRAAAYGPSGAVAYPEGGVKPGHEVKLKRDASVVFGLQGAIGCPDPSLVPPWRLFPRASLGGWKIV